MERDKRMMVDVGRLYFLMTCKLGVQSEQEEESICVWP